MFEFLRFMWFRVLALSQPAMWIPGVRKTGGKQGRALRCGGKAILTTYVFAVKG
jgi:hypothetical protein